MMPLDMEKRLKLSNQLPGFQFCDAVCNNLFLLIACLLLGELQSLNLFAWCFLGLGGGVFCKIYFSWHREEMIKALAKSAVCFASC